MSRASMGLCLMALTGCSAASQAVTPSPAVPSQSVPSQSVPSHSASPHPSGPPSCHTPDLEMAIGAQRGAAGHIGLDFEVRNRSARECTVVGYFGLALLTSEGKVAIAALRSTRIFTAATGPPQAVVLPPGSAPLPASTAPGGAPPTIPGHAHFAAAYGDVCNNAPNGTGNAWQLYPPDETQPTSILAPNGHSITICGLQVTPVQATPPTP